MSKKFAEYDAKIPLPFILLFEELPDTEAAIDGVSIRKYIDNYLEGIEHKTEFLEVCYCEIGDRNNV